MKFIFVVQGEGRGHATQAIALQERLQDCGHEVVKVYYGTSPHRPIADFVKEKFEGKLAYYDSPNFLPSKKKTNILKSFFYNLLLSRHFYQSADRLAADIAGIQADRVVNFYEPLLGVAYSRNKILQPMICIAHQYTFLHPDYSFPKGFFLRKRMLQYLTNKTRQQAMFSIALSLVPMSDLEEKHIYVAPPLIRKQVLQATSRQGDYLHGYLLNEGYLQEIDNPSLNIDVNLFVGEACTSKNPHVKTFLLNDSQYLSSMAGAKAVICTAGFETVAEAMYLGKPVLVVPVNFEQQCNANEMQRGGAGVADKHFDIARLNHFVSHYINNNVNFPIWEREHRHKIVDLLTAE